MLLLRGTVKSAPIEVFLTPDQVTSLSDFFFIKCICYILKSVNIFVCFVPMYFTLFILTSFERRVSFRVYVSGRCTDYFRVSILALSGVVFGFAHQHNMCN